MAATPSRPRTKAAAAATAAVAALLVTLVFTVLPARATVPTITGPDRVFTLPNIPLPFTGTEPFAAPKSRVISISASDAGTCAPQATPQVLTGCSSIKLDVNNGVLKLTPGNAIPTSGDPIGGQATLQLSGHVADLNTALASLIYVPSNNYQNLPDTPARLTINAIDGASGDNTSSGSPDNSWTVDIRVANLNGPPTMTDPNGPIAVGASMDDVQTGNTYLAGDPDANNNGENGKVLLVKWVSCGNFDISPSGNYAIGTDLKSIMKNQLGLDDTEADAFYALLPSQIKNLMLAATPSNATAIAAIGTLTDINNGLSTVTFHAPSTPSTCTMTDLIDDLGAHGLPGQYENFTHLPGENPTGIELPAMLFAFDTVDYVVAGGAVPQVDIEQGSTQLDPTTVSPITFDVTFDMDVTGFATGDVTLSGTAGATTATVTPIDASHYTVTVSGMTQSGTVIASIPAAAATASAVPNNPSAASTSTDHTVTYNVPAGPLTVTIDQGASQVDPTTVSPIVFDVAFSAAVTGFTNPDVDLSGTAGATTANVVDSGDHQHYTVSVSGMTTSGTVIATIPSAAAQDAGLQDNTASTSTDNTVQYNQPAVPPLTVTINQGASQVDPTTVSPIVFDVAFSAAVTGFTNADVNLSGTAGATTANVVDSGDHQHFTVSVSGMTTSGTVIASIPADAAQDAGLQINEASTSTDHTVQYNQPAVPPLTVTINQGASQVDPTTVSPIVFDVAFSAAVTGFTNADVDLSGTAGATTVAVVDSGDHQHYTVSASGMATSGTVIATVPADAAQDAGLQINEASTSTDNTVQYNQPVAPTPPTVTINQAVGQVDPTTVSPIVFDVAFSAPVTGFTAVDVILSGTAGATTVTVVDSGDHQHFTVSASGMTTSGTVIATIPAAAAQDAGLQDNTASTSTDNTVQYDQPVAPTPLTVTIDQAVGQADPTSTSPIHFTVVFSAPVTGFSATDVILAGTAGATTAVVTGSGANYDVAVSGMTTSGTVIATIPADAADDASQNVNEASTSTDNTVTYNVPTTDTTPTSSTPTSSTPTSSTPGNGSANNGGSTNVQGANAVQAVDGTLPFTGSSSGLLVLVGATLSLGGLVLVVATRRRRQPLERY